MYPCRFGKQERTMKAMNLYLLTRALGEEDFSRLARELTGEVRYRKYSRHEAESLRALIGHIEGALRKREVSGRNCVSFLDGFYFSGAGTDNVCRNKSSCFCNDLACQNFVPFGYHRICRCTDMLAQRVYHLCFRQNIYNFLTDFTQKVCIPPEFPSF